MAGIGFELKKMFSKKGLLSTIKAYGYAGIVCIGPMLLGIVMLLGIRFLADLNGAVTAEKELLNCMVTYTLLFSMLLTNLFSLVVTRFIADQLYMGQKERVMPSLWGSVSIMLVLGGFIYGIFLLNSGVSVTHGFLCFMLFGELVLVWTQINYLTAIKDYHGILLTFIVALILSWIAAVVLLLLKVEVVAAMMVSVCIAYGIMMVWYHILLVSYFPKGKKSPLHFLKWFEKYKELAFIGLFLSMGLFGHLVIMWTGNAGTQIKGLFYAAPQYDIPALLAFLSILITTVNFVTSVEVNFYPKYKTYFSLYNDGGTLIDIKQAEKEMVATLRQELTYTFTKQFFASVVFILAGSLLLPYLPLGMDHDMLGIYRILCIGYAFYSAGNCIMLLQLYFSDGYGALLSCGAFMGVSCLVTWFTRDHSITYYGFGFLAGSLVYLIVSFYLLVRYLDQVMYHVLCQQPIVAKETHGILSKISNWHEAGMDS